MQLDLETIRWILSGIFFVGGGIVSWLIGRQVSKLDTDMTEQYQRIKTNEDQITDFKLDVAKNYVSKLELEKQLEGMFRPIRDDVRDIKEDLKSLLKRP